MVGGWPNCPSCRVYFYEPLNTPCSSRAVRRDQRGEGRLTAMCPVRRCGEPGATGWREGHRDRGTATGAGRPALWLAGVCAPIAEDGGGPHELLTWKQHPWVANQLITLCRLVQADVWWCSFTRIKPPCPSGASRSAPSIPHATVRTGRAYPKNGGADMGWMSMPRTLWPGAPLGLAVRVLSTFFDWLATTYSSIQRSFTY